METVIPLTNGTKLKHAIDYFNALVWFINGFFCKILDLVPRHHQIVAAILGDQHARLLTVAIGFAEVLMAIWIIIRYIPRLNASVQILVIITMNLIEFVLVPHLLLWERLNIVFALLFVALIYLNTFTLGKQSAQPI